MSELVRRCQKQLPLGYFHPVCPHSLLGARTLNYNSLCITLLSLWIASPSWAEQAPKQQLIESTKYGLVGVIEQSKGNSKGPATASIAVIKEIATQKTFALRVGARLPSGAKIVSISKGSVGIEEFGQTQQIGLRSFDTGGSTASAKSAPAIDNFDEFSPDDFDEEPDFLSQGPDSQHYTAPPPPPPPQPGTVEAENRPIPAMEGNSLQDRPNYVPPRTNSFPGDKSPRSIPQVPYDSEPGSPQYRKPLNEVPSNFEELLDEPLR